MNRRRWVVWLAAAAAIVLTARLGLWQLDRAAQKLALHEAREQWARKPVLALSSLPRTPAAARAMEQRRVQVSGRWLAERSIFLDNRPMAGRVGFYVLTPLVLNDGAVLLVQRGWWPRDAAERTRIAAPPPPVGEVSVDGRITLTPSRLVELAPDEKGPIRQNLDVDTFARETGLPLLPWVLVQLEPPADTAATDGLARQWPEPASDVHKHYGYAAQWFALSALVLGLLLWFQVVRPRWRR